MNPTFNILTPGASYSECNLLLNINDQGIAFIVINENLQCSALSFYSFKAGFTQEEIADTLKHIVSQQAVLQQSFKKTTIVYGFPQSLLIPDLYWNEASNKEQMNLLYGEDADGIIKTDVMVKQSIHNVYRVSKAIDRMLVQLFPQAIHYHLHSLLPQLINSSSSMLYCIFGSSAFTVLLQKEGKLQLVQNFGFNNPEDLVYHLLNICQRYEVNVNDIKIYLNGMIDEAGKDYQEIFNYFLHPVFGTLPIKFTYNKEIKKHPEHNFSHLFELAACV